jgi:hypothetical protein
VRNTGKGPLSVTSVTMEPGTSDFALDGGVSALAAGSEGDLAVTFSPLGPGDDTAEVLIVTDDPDQPDAGRVRLHGGPIWPALDFDPDGGFLSFAPTSTAMTAKYALLRSVGGATLRVSSVGVDQSGNPDFSVVPPGLPRLLKPGETVPVEVDYSRSPRIEEGLMLVLSDDHDAGTRALRLLPDALHQCFDGIDNDGDGLVDFPDDPGCDDADDSSETNPAQCVEGAMRNCGSSIGACKPGVQACLHGAWYPCDGGTKAMSESCNGSDDNCNGVTDEGITELCTLNGCMGVRLCLPDAGVAGGAFSNCMPVTTSSEICNGLDDDCDGMTDEGIVETCTLNGCLGTHLCIPGGDGGYTACQPANPATEICNGSDDNCDGVVDNVMPALQTCGFGVCARTAPACVDGGIPACMPGTGVAEICNGIDDDCDGTTDNTMPATQSCGTGACARTVPMCAADGGMSACVPGMQSTETCNNVDDNCNGTTDEGVTASCYDGGAQATRNVGRCHDGTTTCAAGAFGPCVGQSGPIPEVCGNGLDDNCAGGVDDGCAVDGGCDPRGLWLLDGGALSYYCCSGAVSFNINSFWFADAGVNFRAIGKPTQPYNNVQTTTYPTCPAGGFTASRFASGGGFGCDETYTLTVTFTGTNTWTGTFSADYTSPGCTDPSPFPFGCGAEPCNSQSWSVQGYR